MNYKEQARELLEEWELCLNARAKGDVISIQLEKDSCSKFAYKLLREYTWGSSETDLAEACLQFEPRLKHLKEKIVIEVLQNGTI